MKVYTDLNPLFKESNNQDAATSFDIESIKNALLRFLQTPIGSVPFNRAYGSSLYSLLFQSNVDINQIQMFLYMDITSFEPRISIQPGSIELMKIDNNTYKVTCSFTVPLLNNQSGSITTTVSKE